MQLEHAELEGRSRLVLQRLGGLAVWAALAFSCSGADEIVAGSADASSAPAASESALSVAGAPSGPPASPPAMPASFEKYAAEIDARCPISEADSSTAGMARAQIAAAECQAKIMAHDGKRLAPGQRGALLDGDPNGPHRAAPEPTPSPSLWAITADAACNVESAQRWLHGGTMMAGTMEVQISLGCLYGADRALGFLTRAWAEAKPADVVSYVRATAGQRPAPGPRLTSWRRYAGLARRTAPHEASRSCALQCRWSDADWIAFERDLDRSEQGAAKLARGLCAEWKELAAAFGGVAACEREMAAQWLPSASLETAEGEDPKPDAVADPPETTLGPPPDDAYDLATLALRRGWSASDGEVAGAAAYLEAARGEVTASARADLLRWVERVEEFRDRLAAADGAAALLGVSSATAGWLASPAPNAAPTMRLLEGYLLRTVVAGKEGALKSHVEGRAAWGRSVETQLGKARAAFKKPCKPASLRDCKGVTKADFDQVAARLQWLLDESKALGGMLCDAAPELSRALGPKDCPTLAARHLLSFAKHAGDPALLEEW